MKPNRNAARKLFFGLFVFPLVIAVGMAVLLCSVVFLTSEEETPESLITAIKTGSPSKRWQKAFELSNELNHSGGMLRDSGVMNEIIHILRDDERYDAKTRSYMAVALAHFKGPAVITALRGALDDPSDDVRLYAMWTLGSLVAKEAAGDIAKFLSSDKDSLRKTAAYVIGALGDEGRAPELRRLLDDSADDVRWNAALGLARLGDRSGKDVLLQMLDREALASRQALSDEDIEKIMINAAKGLALVGGPEARPALEDVSRRDPSLKVRQAAIEALQARSTSSGQA